MTVQFPHNSVGDYPGGVGVFIAARRVGPFALRWDDMIDRMIWKLTERCRAAMLAMPGFNKKPKGKNWLDGVTWVATFKSFWGCLYCDESDQSCLDLHHRDPATKVMEVSRMVTRELAVLIVVAEAKKCDVVCANCHRKLHWRNRFALPALVARPGRGFHHVLGVIAGA